MTDPVVFEHFGLAVILGLPAGEQPTLVDGAKRYKLASFPGVVEAWAEDLTDEQAPGDVSLVVICQAADLDEALRAVRSHLALVAPQDTIIDICAGGDWVGAGAASEPDAPPGRGGDSAGARPRSG